MFRTELRNTISAFNEIKPSKTIGVVTGVWKEQLKDNTVDTDYSWAFSFIAIFHLLLVVLFALFMWPGACYSMVIMFTVRDLVTVFIFMFFHYAKDTDIQLDSTLVVSIFYSINILTYCVSVPCGRPYRNKSLLDYSCCVLQTET